jgi:hypothetical protein
MPGAAASTAAPASSASGSLACWASGPAWLAAVLFAVTGLGGWAACAQAAPPNGAAAAPATLPAPRWPWPDEAQLAQLRDRAWPAAPCENQCADIPRAWLQATPTGVQLRLEVHALAPVSVPLPGPAGAWQAAFSSTGPTPPPLRRDDQGQLWASLPAGLHTLTLQARDEGAASLSLALPMPIRHLQSQLQGWSLSGLDPRGLASAGLVLNRTSPTTARTPQEEAAAQNQPSQALLPFVQIERSVSLGLQWSVRTQIRRISPSRQPVQVRYQLLPGESMTDPTVTTGQGHAMVTLGTDAPDEGLVIESALEPTPSLSFHSNPAPQQVEVWRVRASPSWHATWPMASGSSPKPAAPPPSQWFTDGQWEPVWHPWPGESLQLQITRPKGVPGQTFTIDGLHTELTAGAEATDVRVVLNLRTSLGGNHRLTLPDGVEWLGAELQGTALPVRPVGAQLVVPMVPGQHQLVLRWREPRGMGSWYRTTHWQPGSSGVNETLLLQVPQDRVVLALGGSRMGPAVLLWGPLLVLAALAWWLGKIPGLPMKGSGWLLLMLGLGPVSLWHPLLVLGWLLLLYARGQWVEKLGPRPFKAVQLVIALGAPVVALLLLDALRTGLLGYPNLMVAGHQSSAHSLNWLFDRFQTHTHSAWVVSMPVWLYRLLMLAWALWLASALLGWIRWAWERFTVAGLWPGRTTPHA